MGIKPKFSNGYVMAIAKEHHTNILNAAIYAMRVLAEELVIYAKDNRNYIDQTGNLTNSIGYVITRNGNIVYKGGFQGGGEPEASKRGLMLAQEVASETKNDLSIIIVAGMNYAAYVEAKGYNVILPAELKALIDFPATMKRLRTKIRNTYDLD